jgi:hypothetical protein
MRIAIIGGGWFGAHIATILLDHNHDVTLFERNHELLHEASGNNQFRLHQGFHYPCNHETRVQAWAGFYRFMQAYPHLTREIPVNLYAVPERDSLLDFRTYCTIMKAAGLPFTIVPAPDFLTGIEGCIQVSERLILTAKARAHFTRRLAGVAQFGRAVSLADVAAFDRVVDATYGHLCPVPIEIFYEQAILLRYHANQPFPAVMLVYGPLCAIYPTEEPDIFTLASVRHTPVDGVVDVEAKRAAMEDEVARHFPTFHDIFRFVGPQISDKTKMPGLSEGRACRVFQQGKVISVLSGKISGIFMAADRVLEIVGG